MLLYPIIALAQEDSTSIINKRKVIEYGRNISFGIEESSTATAIITEEDLSHKKSINNTNMLYGLAPGLQVRQSADNAWNDGALLNIRGVGTLSSTSPLVLFDGFERSLNEISSDEIESITILKDATTALYGIKGANGVVLVKTKRGQSGKAQINVSYNFDMGSPIRLPKLVDGYTYANALNESLTNDGLPARYASYELDAFKDQNHPSVYPNVNWWDEALRDHSYGNNFSFSARGGGKFVSYYTLLNYINDNGILKPTLDNEGYSNQFKYSKLNIRTNLDIFLSSTTTVQLNLYGNFSEHNRPGASTSDIFSGLYQIPSGAFPIKATEELWGGTTVYSNNPIANISARGYARSQIRTMYADIKLDQDLSRILEGLSVGAHLGLDNTASYWDSNTKNFGYASTSMNWADDVVEHNILRNEGSLSFSRSVGTSVNHFNLNAYTNYKKSVDKHNINATLLYSMDKKNVKGQNNSRAFMDIVGQAHYAYDNRYIVDFALSGSASSILKPGKQWGIFPSIGAAWVLSEEDFLSQDWMNLLKFRTSYGISGNASYGVDLFLDKYGTGNGYFFGNNPASIGGYKITQLGINDLTYEKSHKLNAGFDFMAFDKLSLSIDGFYDHRTDILVSGSNAVSSIFGLNTPSINNGVVDSYGFESSVRWSDNIGDFKYQIGGMFTLNKNEIINMNEEYRPHDYLKRTGKSIGSRFGYEVLGIFKDQDEVDNSPKQNLSNVQPGDLKYKDQNGDGVIDSYDQIYLGYSNMPEIYYSFDINIEYKGVGLYAMFQGADRVTQYLNTPSVYWPMFNNSTISDDYYNNRWTETNTNAKYPRLTSEGSANNYTANSLWIANSAYLKLRTVELYYDIPSNILNRTSFLKGTKVFVRGHDILCFDGMKLLDPENVGANNPLMSKGVIGVNLTF